MSIEHVGGEYYPTCDCCGCELPARATYIGAFAAMRADGWRRRKSEYDSETDGYHNEDICPECLDLENG